MSDVLFSSPEPKFLCKVSITISPNLPNSDLAWCDFSNISSYSSSSNILAGLLLTLKFLPFKLVSKCFSQANILLNIDFSPSPQKYKTPDSSVS